MQENPELGAAPVTGSSAEAEAFIKSEEGRMALGDLVDTRIDHVGHPSQPIPPEAPTRHLFKPKDGYAWNPLRDYPRNEACFCGSLKKFKKCHDGKLPMCCTVKSAHEIRQFMAQRFRATKLDGKFKDPGPWSATYEAQAQKFKDGVTSAFPEGAQKALVSDDAVLAGAGPVVQP